MRALFLLGLPLLTLSACGAADAGSGTDVSSGPRVSRDLPLSGFSAVAAAGSEDIDIRVGPAFAVRVEAPREVFDRLEIVVEGGTLKIRHKPGVNWPRMTDRARAKVSVAMPRLQEALLAGSGNMTVDRVSGGAFKGAVTGSGDLRIAAVDAPRLELMIAGSGDITASGRAGTAEYSVAGSGDLHAGAVQVQTLAASIAGSGSIDARARSPVKVSIVGSGDVTVAGAPCTTTRIGSGEARCG